MTACQNSVNEYEDQSSKSHLSVPIREDISPLRKFSIYNLFYLSNLDIVDYYGTYIAVHISPQSGQSRERETRGAAAELRVQNLILLPEKLRNFYLPDVPTGF